jgi:hypothetical protein
LRSGDAERHKGLACAWEGDEETKIVIAINYSDGSLEMTSSTAKAGAEHTPLFMILMMFEV